MQILIDGVPIAMAAGFDIQQTFEPRGGFDLIDMGDGSARPQFRWSKLETTISGGGWFPDGLANLDTKIAHEIACGIPLGINGAGGSNVVTLPAGRRSDAGYEPYARAVVNGELLDTGVSIVGNVATCDVISGATLYTVYYFPRLNFWIHEGIRRQGDAARGTLQWTLRGREV